MNNISFVDIIDAFCSILRLVDEDWHCVGHSSNLHEIKYVAFDFHLKQERFVFFVKNNKCFLIRTHTMRERSAPSEERVITYHEPAQLVAYLTETIDETLGES